MAALVTVGLYRVAGHAQSRRAEAFASGDNVGDPSASGATSAGAPPPGSPPRPPSPSLAPWAIPSLSLPPTAPTVWTAADFEKQNPNQTLNETQNPNQTFDELPLARRFLARGACHARPFDPKSLHCTSTSGGGWGNKMQRMGGIMSAAQSAGKVPVVGRMPGFMALRFWFAKAVPAVPIPPGCARDKRRRLGAPDRLGDHEDEDPPTGCDASLRRYVDDLTPELQARLDMDCRESGEEERQLKNTGAGGCAMRQYMDHPTSELWQRLQVTTAALRPTDVVVGMHLRFGDGHIFENVTGANGGPHKDDQRLQMKDVEVMHQSLEAFVREIEERDPRLRVRMFVASDVPAGVENVKNRWGERMLPLRNKIAFHTNYGRTFDNAPEYQGLKRALFADLVSDWFFLAMADVIMQPMGSSFSQTAGWLGMQGPCHKDLRRGLVNAAAWGPCIEQIVGSM